MNELLKVVFTLTSGKSIVSHLDSEICFEYFGRWLEFEESDNKNDKIIIEKRTRDDKIVECLGILYRDVSAIQIQDSNIHNKKNSFVD